MLELPVTRLVVTVGLLVVCCTFVLGLPVNEGNQTAVDGTNSTNVLSRKKRSEYGYGEFDTINEVHMPVARRGYGKKKRRGKKVVHLIDCHDAHDCHQDDGHVINFDSHDDYDYHDDDHDYDYDHDYNDHGSYGVDYHDDHGHDYDYHDDHGDYDHDYHDDHDDYHDYDDHDDHEHKKYRPRRKNVYKPKVVIIKKIISQSTTTLPLPPT